jgi:hypothetical protein
MKGAGAVQMRRALDTKEALLSRLRTMNDEVDAGMHKEENGARTAAFQKAYAQVLVDLKLVSHHRTLRSSKSSVYKTRPCSFLSR